MVETMRVEIRQGRSPGTWDLLVNGVMEMAGESHQVVSKVRDSLTGGCHGAVLEADEVAWEIARAYRT